MANGYMPRADASAKTWMVQFANELAARPETFKVTPDEIAAIATAVDAFVTALQSAVEPGTRTVASVRGKDVARRSAEMACRPIYLRIKADPTISDADKLVLGVRPVNHGRSRINKPDSSPILRILPDASGGHVIRFADMQSSSRVAKPKGAVGLLVFRHIGNAPPTSMEQMSYYATLTRYPTSVHYSGNDDLKIATYIARWITRRGETGPWSNVVSVRIANVGVTMENHSLAA